MQPPYLVRPHPRAPRAQAAPAWLSDVASAAVGAALLIAGLLLFTAAVPVLRSWDAVANLLVSWWVYALPALGLMLVMATGRMDLSAASVAALAGAVAARLAVSGIPLLLAFVPGALLAAAVGALSGLLASISRPASFVVTFATAGLSQALAAAIMGSGGAMLPGGSSAVGPLLIPAVLLAMAAAALVVIALLSPAGAWLRLLADEGQARADLVTTVVGLVVAYAAAALLSAAAGVVEVARVGGALPRAPVQLELAVVATAILGGASLRGGRGVGYGVLVAALGAAVLLNGLAAASVNAVFSVAALVVLVAAALLWDELRARLFPAGGSTTLRSPRAGL